MYKTPPSYRSADLALQAACQFIFSVKRQPVDKRKEHVIPAILGYCTAWNLHFFRKIQDQLPGEIRDIIYGYLWDDESLSMLSDQMCSSTRVECGENPDISCNDIVNKPVAPTIRSCISHARQPFFTKAGYVGAEAAREVVEAWYVATRRRKPFGWKSVGVGSADLIINNDAFLVGLDPASILKELDIAIYISNPYEFLGEYEGMSKAASKEHFLSSLLRIQRKRGFKLTIALMQKYIRLNQWSEIFDNLRPVIDAYEKEGADACVVFVYDNWALKPRIELDVLPWIKDPDQDWRQEAIAFFDSQPRLRQRHKHYHIENNTDYDPDSYPKSEDEHKMVGDVLDSYHSDNDSYDNVSERIRGPRNQFVGTLMVLDDRWNE